MPNETLVYSKFLPLQEQQVQKSNKDTHTQRENRGRNSCTLTGRSINTFITSLALSLTTRKIATRMTFTWEGRGRKNYPWSVHCLLRLQSELPPPPPDRLHSGQFIYFVGGVWRYICLCWRRVRVDSVEI